jgi:hypothetical protein
MDIKSGTMETPSPKECDDKRDSISDIVMKAIKIIAILSIFIATVVAFKVKRLVLPIFVSLVILILGFSMIILWAFNQALKYTCFFYNFDCKQYDTFIVVITVCINLLFSILGGYLFIYLREQGKAPWISIGGFVTMLVAGALLSSVSKSIMESQVRSGPCPSFRSTFDSSRYFRDSL